MTRTHTVNNCGIFKQALENSPEEFRSTCGSKDVAIKKFKIVKN